MKPFDRVSCTSGGIRTVNPPLAAVGEAEEEEEGADGPSREMLPRPSGTAGIRSADRTIT